MTRNLKEYQDNYLKQPYEKYQAIFRRRKVIDELGKYNHNNLLEVGCGLDSIFNSIESYNSLIVLEPAQAFYEKALLDRQKAKNKNIEIHNIKMEDAVNTILNKKFDFIIVASLLHEITDHMNFLKIIHEATSPETIIHINVPNANSIHRLLGLEMGIIDNLFQPSLSNVLFQQSRVFDMQLLQRAVLESGFKLIDSGSYAIKPFTHKQMQEMIDCKLLTEEMLEALNRLSKYLPDLGSEIFVNVVRNE